MKKEHIINVKPFKSKTDLNNFLTELKNTKHGQRNVLIAKIGLTTGLRISDILKLNVSDIKNKTQTTIIEKKTGKKRTIYLDNIIGDIINYLNTLDNTSEWLFPAPSNKSNHLSEHQYYKILQKTADLLGFDFIGTHTLRKTFARFFYLETKDISTLMTILNHSSQKITLNYIDITEDDIKASLKTFNPFI